MSLDFMSMTFQLLSTIYFNYIFQLYISTTIRYRHELVMDFYLKDKEENQCLLSFKHTFKGNMNKKSD